jgi:outer membrane protein OmpA-like peptidoglycan-associated protein
MFERARTSKMVWRLSALLMTGAALSACSSVPDWVDPTTWVGGSSDTQTATSDSQAGTDQGTTGAAGSQGQTVAEASDQYPALADVPGKAPPSTSTDEQRQVAGGLVADRTQAQYSAEALRGGTEPAAAPPGAAIAETESLPPPSDNASTASQPSEGAANTNANSAPSQTAAAALSGPPPMPGTLPSEAPGSAAEPAQARVASVAPSVATAPTPPPPSARAAAPQLAPNDAALGFQPSHAPPLDPQFGQSMSAGSQIRHQRVATVNPTATTVPSVGAPSGTPAAVVSFAQSGATLDDAARAQVRTAVQAYRAAGGQGYVRVVGHAPGGRGSEQQVVSAFSRSQACADAVARELVKQGVPAGRVLVDAVGDAGGDAGRRAEIFLQS